VQTGFQEGKKDQTNDKDCRSDLSAVFWVMIKIALSCATNPNSQTKAHTLDVQYLFGFGLLQRDASLGISLVA